MLTPRHLKSLSKLVVVSSSKIRPIVRLMLMSTKKLDDVSGAKDTDISSTSANRLRQYVDAVL